LRNFCSQKAEAKNAKKKSFAVSWIAVFMSQWSGWHFIDAKVKLTLNGSRKVATLNSSDYKSQFFQHSKVVFY